jgi:ABC-2 type transport system ATP-binding protein
MEKPDVIMLDEPTNALDEMGIEEIRKVILEEKERGALILVASHNKEDIQVLADELYKVENGLVIKQGAGL